MTRIREHDLAHRFLDGLTGLEIGASSHNPFGLNTRNVDASDPPHPSFCAEQRKWCGEVARVDIVADAGKIPVPDASEDFVLSSHVLEHVWNPIDTLVEWYRIVRPGGFIFTIVPRRDALLSDAWRPVTPLSELIWRRGFPMDGRGTREHLTVFDLGSFWGMVLWMRAHLDLAWGVVAVEDPDQKVGNGFAVVVRKS